jgi:hypothetical protein
LVFNLPRTSQRAIEPQIMRLLRIEEDGSVSLNEYAKEDKPRFAILSHRWGPNHEEVTFKDMVENTGRDKKGFEKIRACGEQAKRDDYDLFWVDTCCIDKSSSAELSESINSMWRYYRDSGVCYAYLDDVQDGVEAPKRDAALAASKWFTRGWTLQELLAPSRLVLYNQEWKVVGTKDELADEISKITNISREYLNTNTPLQWASIAERMSWASTRTTTRLEDRAYSLLGIFDINMPLLYGEGARAFQRLQEEIVKRSDDQSILAWGSSGIDSDGDRLFAYSPDSFRSCGNIVRSVEMGTSKPYTTTNKGLQIDLPLIKDSDHRVQALLNCRKRNDVMANLAIHLRKVGDGRVYERLNNGFCTLPFATYRGARMYPIYIAMAPRVVELKIHLKDNSTVVQKLPQGYNISKVFPSLSWSPGTQTFEGSHIQGGLVDPDNRTLAILRSNETSLAFMTFFRQNRVLGDWVWDARLLPAPEAHELTDIEHLFSKWKSEDLSILPRVQQLSGELYILRAVSQMVRGRRLTTIEVVPNFLPFDAIMFLKILEQILVVCRTIGHRFLRMLWWGFDHLFDGPALSGSLNACLSLIAPCSCIYMMLSSESSAILISLLVICSSYTAMYFVDMYRAKPRTSSEEAGFTWRDVREFDALIGYSVLSIVIYALFALCFGLLLRNSGSLILIPLLTLLLSVMLWLKVGLDEICLSLFPLY